MHRTAILFLAAVAAVAQGPGHIAILRGELSPGVSLSPDYIVELESTAGALPTHREFVSPTGAFQFKDVEQGHYRLIVRNLGGDVVKQEFVNVMDSSPLVIQLPVSKTVSPPAGAISAQHLRAEGHNNLGRRYMTSKEYAKAAEEFQKAADLSGHPTTYLNLGIALFSQGRVAEAEPVVRRALQLDPDSLKAGYVLGLVLVMQRKYTPEAESLLARAQESFPKARLLIDVIHAHKP